MLTTEATLDKKKLLHTLNSWNFVQRFFLTEQHPIITSNKVKLSPCQFMEKLPSNISESCVGLASDSSKHALLKPIYDFQFFLNMVHSLIRNATPNHGYFDQKLGELKNELDTYRFCVVALLFDSVLDSTLWWEQLSNDIFPDARNVLWVPRSLGR